MYLIPLQGKKKIHLWDDPNDETVCKLSSTGGLDRRKYQVVSPRPHNYKNTVCKMCRRIRAKGEGEKDPISKLKSMVRKLSPAEIKRFREWFSNYCIIC